MVGPQVKTFIDGVIQDVAELPDRTSPEGQPNMMLVTPEELHRIIEDRLMLTGLQCATPDQLAGSA